MDKFLRQGIEKTGWTKDDMQKYEVYMESEKWQGHPCGVGEMEHKVCLQLVEEDGTLSGFRDLITDEPLKIKKPLHFGEHGDWWDATGQTRKWSSLEMGSNNDFWHSAWDSVCVSLWGTQ